MIKQQILLSLAFCKLAFGTTIIPFSDSIDVSGTGGADPFILDSSSYSNTIIGTQWAVDAGSSSNIGDFRIDYYPSFFFMGNIRFNEITVHGTISGGTVNLTANYLTPDQQIFTHTAGANPNEFDYDLRPYSANQGGTTLITGFDSITRIDFNGVHVTVPEPSTSILLGLSAVGLLFARRKCRTRSCTQPPACSESIFSR